MAGVIEYTTQNKKASAILEDVYVVANGDSERDEHDSPVTSRNENMLLSNMCNIQCGGLPSTPQKNHMQIKSRGVSVASKKHKSTSRPVDLICSQFPTNSNSTVGVDVSCGAINAFSNDVPYNSVGLSLARSVDTNPGGFLSQHTRRRRRPTLLSSLSSSPSRNDSNENIIRRRLMASGIHLSAAGRRRTFRSSSPGVERFNYAKALLRSDIELEKLSRKIRSEINESELFELALAAEEAADLGVTNFSGRASTFGGEPHQKQQKESNKAEAGHPLIGILKPLVGDSMSTNSRLAQIPCSSRTTPTHFKASEFNDNGLQNVGSSPIRFSEQSLLEHARAAAAAVVVAPPAAQQQRATLIQVRKVPERRSMRINSLRDVHEVIPHWKELHGHMRTHFYRSNVNTDSLFFGEKEAPSTLLSPFSIRKNISPSFNQAQDDDIPTNHKRTKSFFDNIAGMKLLNNFRPMKSPRQTAIDGLTDDVPIPKASTKTESLETEEFSVILSPHQSPEKRLGKTKSPEFLVPSGLTQIDLNQNDKFLSIQGASPKVENRDDRLGQTVSLTPRFPKRSDSFDLEILQITGNLLTSPQQPDDSPSLDEQDDTNSENDDGHNGRSDQPGSVSAENAAMAFSPDSELVPFKFDSTASLNRERRDFSETSSEKNSVCPVSPSNDSSLLHFDPRHIGPTSPTSPSTPNHSMILQRKDSGFSTPAHLRMIKGLHVQNDDEIRFRREEFLELSKTEDLDALKLEDEALTATPATGVYSQFEPNSIVQNSSERSQKTQVATPLPCAETRHLAIPMIQSSKSESRKFMTTSYDSQSTHKNSGKSRILLRRSKRELDCDSEVSSSVHSKKNPHTKITAQQCIDDSKSSSSPNLCISPLALTVESDGIGRLTSSMLKLSSNRSAREILCNKEEDEKKECDGTISSLNLGAYFEIEDERQKYVINLFPDRDEKQNGNNPAAWQDSSTEGEGEKTLSMLRLNNDSECSTLRKNKSVLKLQKRTDGYEANQVVKNSCITTKEIESIDNRIMELEGGLSASSIKRHDASYGRDYPTDATSGDNLSVCQSLPSTDVTFKTAVQTVQGVAVQTVQEVFSHLSLGSPKSQLKSKEWEAERENKEFLSNYFYCAKSLESDKVQHLALNNSVAQVKSSNSEGERLVCTEPCNGLDTPCYMFGIDTMCGGLINLIPRDINVDSDTGNKWNQDKNGVTSEVKIRGMSPSMSMGQTHQRCRKSFSGINSSEQGGGGNWLGMFRRVASERFNFQFQTEENELEKSRHPYTPPCLNRRVPTQSQTL